MAWKEGCCCNPLRSIKEEPRLKGTPVSSGHYTDFDLSQASRADRPRSHRLKSRGATVYTTRKRFKFSLREKDSSMLWC